MPAGDALRYRQGKATWSLEVNTVLTVPLQHPSLMSIILSVANRLFSTSQIFKYLKKSSFFRKPPPAFVLIITGYIDETFFFSPLFGDFSGLNVLILLKARGLCLRF